MSLESKRMDNTRMHLHSSWSLQAMAGGVTTKLHQMFANTTKNDNNAAKEKDKKRR